MSNAAYSYVARLVMLMTRVIACTAATITIATMTVGAPGEYLVEVVRRAPYCEPPVISHLLSLSLTAQPHR